MWLAAALHCWRSSYVLANRHATPFENDHVKRHALLQILRDTRALLARPENNFDWSSWENGEAAVREIDALIECVGSGAELDPQQLGVLFAPTGPIQEVSIRTGWAESFLELAERLEAAMR